MKCSVVLFLLKFQSASSRVTCISLGAIVTFRLTAPPFTFRAMAQKEALRSFSMFLKNFIFTGLDCEPPQFTSSKQDTTT